MSDSNYIECESCACFLARRSARLLTQYFDKALRPSGIRGTQFTLLVALIRFDRAVQPMELSEILGIERTTLTRNLQTLEESTFVKLGSGNDKRTRLISITASGRAAVKKAYPYWQKAQAKVTKEIPESQLQAIAWTASHIQ